MAREKRKPAKCVSQCVLKERKEGSIIPMITDKKVTEDKDRKKHIELPTRSSLVIFLNVVYWSQSGYSWLSLLLWTRVTS